MRIEASRQPISRRHAVPMLAMLTLAGCARGAVTDLLDDSGLGIDEAGAQAGEPCEMGASVACNCEDGGIDGQRTCVPNADSPAYGYLSACSGCRAPGGSDADLPRLDASLPDAMVPDAAPDVGAQDTGMPEGSTGRCADGLQNGAETDVDCGAECGGCIAGKRCVASTDCAGNVSCTGGVCAAASTPSFRNYDHASFTYTRVVDWSCAGTTRFDSSGSGSWVQSTACSNSDATRPEVTCGVAQTAPGGPEVCILRARGLTIGAGHTLELVGERPVILAVEGNATIAGIVSADANGSSPGAGGNWSCGTSQGGNGTGSTGRFDGASGGGGGGFGTRGGSGGTADTDGSNSNGGSGGQVRGNASLSPLLGGCAGGRAGGCDTAGGAGGGAVQIAASGMLIIRGTVRASGGAGATPCGANDEGGGSGAGAGGGILLQAGSVDIAGATLQARGGAGGRNGSYAGIYNCGDSAGGSGATSSTQDGANGQSCQGGSSGAGGGYGRVATP
jgi:hypothetical protein